MFLSGSDLEIPGGLDYDTFFIAAKKSQQTYGKKSKNAKKQKKNFFEKKNKFRDLK